MDPLKHEGDFESERLLEEQQGEQQPRFERRHAELQRNIQRHYFIIAVLYSLAIVTFALSYFDILHIREPLQCPHPDMLSTPAMRGDALGYVTHPWPFSFKDSPYAGDPSPELDLAWHNIFEDANIRVEKEDLDRLNVTSLPLADGGYVAQLGVYHELHCIKKIRHWVFKEQYVYPQNRSEAELAEWPAHINHCIEMLRTAATCRGDTSLSTYEWLEDHHGGKVPTAVDKAPHQCVDWERLHGWVRERTVDISAPGVLAGWEGV